MSEVKRYWVDLDDGTYPAQMHGCNDEIVKASDFDAQRLRADTAEAELKVVRKSRDDELENYNAQISELAATEQRIAELESVLRSAVEWFDDGVGRSIAEFCKLQEMRAALNPNPEAERHKSALKFYPSGKCPECEKGQLKVNGYRYECDTCEFNCGEGDHDHN